MTHGQPDNIDEHKESILNKLNESGYFTGIPSLIVNSKSLPIVTIH